MCGAAMSDFAYGSMVTFAVIASYFNMATVPNQWGENIILCIHGKLPVPDFCPV